MTDFRRIEKAKRQAQRQADLDGGTWCVVEFPGHCVVRPQRRARNLILKHPECKIAAVVEPAVRHD